MDVVIPRPAVVRRERASERARPASLRPVRTPLSFTRAPFSHIVVVLHFIAGSSSQRSASLQPSDSTTSKCFEGCLRSWLLRASPPRVIHCRRPPPLDEVEFELARPLDAQLLAKEGILLFFYICSAFSRVASLWTVRFPDDYWTTLTSHLAKQHNTDTFNRPRLSSTGSKNCTDELFA